MNVKRFLVLLVSLFLVLSAARPAFAGTYLDTAAFLLDESRRGTDWLGARLYDVQLATINHQLAEARVKAGRQLLVPHEVEIAHPHLLLLLEGVERATAAAAEGNMGRFSRLLLQAREEERTFRAILASLKLTVPDLEKCEKTSAR